MKTIQPAVLIFLFFIFSLVLHSHQASVGIHFTHEFISIATIKNDMFFRITTNGHDRVDTSIAIMENGEIMFGEQPNLQHSNRVDQIRFLLEHKFDELPTDFIDDYPSKIIQDHSGNPIVELKFNNGSTELLDPIEAFSILVFEKLKESSEEFLKETVERMIISIPSQLSKQQRRKILDLAPKDLQVDLVDEEILAIKGYDLIPEENSKILIMNWNSFELQVGVWDFSNGKLKKLLEKSDPRIGWNEFDSLFERYWPGGIDLKIDPKQLRCKLAKKQPVQIFDHESDLSNSKLLKEITLEEYIEVSSPLLDIFKQDLHKIMESYPPSQIDHIILFNSTCSFPTISSIIEHQFGKNILHSIDDPILIGATKLSQFQNGNHFHAPSTDYSNKHSHDEL